MIRAKIIWAAVIVMAMAYQLSGQVVVQPKPVEYNLKGVVYATESLFEIRPHLQGFTLAYKTGKLNSYYNTTYFGYEIGYMRDGRERRQSKNEPRLNNESRNAFIYGKRSQFFNLRFNYGQKRYLSEKTKRKGVAMGVIYEGGASLGLIKPYYLNVIRLDEALVDRRVEAVKYSDETRSDFLDFENIYGGTNFWKGFTEMTPTLGLHGKIGMHWALGAFEERVKAFEVGIMVDIYPREIPLMVEVGDINNNFILMKLYASFQFGKRSL